jgi:protein disulfide-isomerase
MNSSFLKSCLFSVLTCFSATLPAHAAGDGVAWTTDFAAAVERAQASGRPLLLKFTGSDWCPPCQRLQAEVFNTDEMARFAADELIAVYVDFPRRKPLSPELKAQNEQLAQRFGIRSFPTVLLLSPDGEVQGRLGYMQGGPKTYIRAVQRVLQPAR